MIDLDPNCTLTETLEPVDLGRWPGRRICCATTGIWSLAALPLTPTGEQWGGVRVCVSDPLLSNREYDLTAPASEERLRRSISLGKPVGWT